MSDASLFAVITVGVALWVALFVAEMIQKWRNKDD